MSEVLQDDFTFNATVQHKVKNGAKGKTRNGFRPALLAFIAICLAIALFCLVTGYENDYGGAGTMLVCAFALFLYGVVPHTVTDVTIDVEFHFTDDGVIIIYRDIDRGDERGTHTEELWLSSNDIFSAFYDSKSGKLTIVHSQNAEGETHEELIVTGCPQRMELLARFNVLSLDKNGCKQFTTKGLVSYAKASDDVIDVSSHTNTELKELPKNQVLQKRALRPYKLAVALPTIACVIFCTVVAIIDEAESFFSLFWWAEFLALIISFYTYIGVYVSAKNSVMQQRILIGPDRLICSGKEGFTYTDAITVPPSILVIDNYKVSRHRIKIYGTFRQDSRQDRSDEEDKELKKFVIWRVTDNEDRLLKLLDELMRKSSVGHLINILNQETQQKK